MTREQFIGMLRSPSVIDLNRVRDLEDIAQQFPYFQNAHLLLARQYYGHENIRYDSYLKKAAAYAPDRKVLYKLIHLPATEVVHMSAPLAAAVAEQLPVSEPVTVHHHVPSEPEPVQPVSAATNNLQPEAATPPSEMPAEHDPRKILEQRLKEIEMQSVPPASVPKTEPTVYVLPSFPETSVVKTEPVLPPPSRKVSDDNTVMRFGDWLKLKSVPVAPPSDMRDYFAETLAHQQPDPAPQFAPASSPNETAVPEPGNIIDKFIREEPRIVPAKSEFYSPGNMARKSLIEHDDLISETLAGIYARQGNKQKAADMYMKLGLKFPEKSAYFAALSKALEQEE